MTPRAGEAAREPETSWASPVTVTFPCGVALSVSPGTPPECPTSAEAVLALVRDRSVCSPVPGKVAAVWGPGGSEVPSSAAELPPGSGPSSVVERSPRGAERSRLSEEDEDKDSVAGSESLLSPGAASLPLDWDTEVENWVSTEAFTTSG